MSLNVIYELIFMLLLFVLARTTNGLPVTVAFRNGGSLCGVLNNQNTMWRAIGPGRTLTKVHFHPRSDSSTVDAISHASARWMTAFGRLRRNSREYATNAADNIYEEAVFSEKGTASHGVVSQESQSVKTNDASPPKVVLRALLNDGLMEVKKPKPSNVPTNDEEYREKEWLDRTVDPFASSPLYEALESPAVVKQELVDRQTGEEQRPVAFSSMEQNLEHEGIRSRPVPNGNWNVEKPLEWTRDFGRRSPAYAESLQSIIHLKPGDEGYFDVSSLELSGIAIVCSKEQAAIVLDKLMTADLSIFHACDTEVMDIDLGTVGPVGNGYCTCVSIYSGPDFDYGLGQGPGATLWIDNLDDACGILQEFKAWFEDERFLKVWHNYGFDRHVLWNEGINVKGFGGDTMHMARLQDSSRARGEGSATSSGYGLEALTADLVQRRKQPMKEIFGIKRLKKDGTEGILVDMPPVEVMQRDPRHRSKWIKYSCYDAEGTWLIREKLAELLKKMDWIKGTNLYDYYVMHMRPFGEVLTDMERRGIRVDAKDYLAKVEIQARADKEKHLQLFRQWAKQKIGADGLAMNTASSVQLCTFLFGGANNEKTKEPTESVRVFKVSRDEIPEDALEEYRLQEEALTTENEVSEAVAPSEVDMFAGAKVVQLKAMCKEQGLKTTGKKAELIERLRLALAASNEKTPTSDDEPNNDSFRKMTEKDLKDALIVRNLPFGGKKADLIERLENDIKLTKELHEVAKPTDRDTFVALCHTVDQAASNPESALAEFLAQSKGKSTSLRKFIDVTITSLGLVPEKFTVGGAPSVTADVLRDLAGDPFSDPPKYGKAFEKLGKDGCEAIYSLCAIGSIDTMIANFLTSLQVLADDQSRVHCSLNLNTETGRLSSRRPNLQNQPALEKDKYKIRKAFESSPGNNLIVADYGQLELRILASITNCKSMIDAFAAGGDFHSRTAMDMFPYIKEKLDSGECLLEWDYSKGSPPKPLLKDMFASERRRAKTLNFSIAYGKTAHGLSADWGVTTDEAQQMLKAWYEARPEVLEWQLNTKAYAKSHGITRTIMGRYRQLPFGKGAAARKLFGRSQRASINTPIQGGAADIAMMAMNKINQSAKLQRLGWILLLQIHDEVILEGPEETAEEAFEEVITCMQEPWVFGLKKTAVPLLVDGSYEHKTWYEAK